MPSRCARLDDVTGSRRRTSSLLAVALAMAAAGRTGSLGDEERVVYRSGEGRYHTYRIPACITTPGGDVLAFCEGRRAGRSDAGDIDLLVRRSRDGGRTWSDASVVWDDGEHTCGNPCPVVDRRSGTIWLLLTHNRGSDREREIIAGTASASRTVWITSSRDDGRTWSPPRNITSSVKDSTWGWYATGPGVGIQVRHGPHAGRLVIPCDHSYQDAEGHLQGGTRSFGAHAIFSDDGGRTWQAGGTIGPRANECQVVELADGNGTLLMNLRAYTGRHRRLVAHSADGGASWSPPRDDPVLVEPVCQASLLRYGWPAADEPGRILFANPASTKREKMTVRVSYDDGATWPVSRVVHPGPAAYASLTVLPDGDVGLLYERGDYEEIVFTRFSLSWLEAERGTAPQAGGDEE